jgi:hypothetical protein
MLQAGGHDVICVETCTALSGDESNRFIDSPAYLEYASATHEVLSARLLAGLTILHRARVRLEEHNVKRNYA